MDEFSLLAISRPRPEIKKSESPKPGSTEKIDDINKGAKAFESYFVQSLLKEMKKGIKKEGGSGYGEGMYQSMFDEAIANNIAERGGFGLADVLIENLSDK